jgi:glycosyltransferase involved in cell wall biosynthesis
LTEDKGVLTLLDACDSLSSRMTFTLLIVGPDDERDSGRIVRRILSSPYDVEYVGAVDDVRPHLGRFRLLALPSRREGFPNVVLEAAAMGVPSVVADSTGTCDSVRHGQTGLVVPVDDVQSLAAAIEMLLSDDVYRGALGAEARRWVTTSFIPRSVVAEILRNADKTQASTPFRHQDNDERSPSLQSNPQVAVEPPASRKEEA